MKHIFVVNPRSFRKKGELDAITNKINSYFANNTDNFSLWISCYPRDAVAVVRRYCMETSDTVRVYAVGGDGILFDCLNGIAKMPNAQLANLPYGTTNNFIRAFGDKFKPDFLDIDKQVNSNAIDTDLIHCGSNYGINFCSAGVESYAVIVASKFMKKVPHVPKFLIGMTFLFCSMSAIFNKPLLTQHYNIIIDGKKYDGEYASICVANGPCYGGNLSATPMSLPNDGVLNIMLFRNANKFKLISGISKYTHGQYNKIPNLVQHIPAKEILIRSSSTIFLNIDGETFYDTSISAKIVPNAVKFVAASDTPYVTFNEKNKI